MTAMLYRARVYRELNENIDVLPAVEMRGKALF